MSNLAKVGLFMVAALAVLGYLIFKVEDLELFGASGQRIEARFASVAGLDDKAAVRIAGVRVGKVDGIRLEGRTAIVGLLLDPPLDLPEGTQARISSLGLLGDKYVELVQGPATGSFLVDGATIAGETPAGWDEAMAQLSEIGGTLQRSLDAVDPEETGRLVRNLLANLDRTTATLRDLVEANRGAFDRTADNFARASGTLAAELPRLADQMEGLLAQIDAVVAENRETLSTSLDEVAKLSTSMQASVDDLNTITAGLAAGEGTLGKLLRSDEAHDQLTSTLGAMEEGVDSLSETFGKITSLGLDLSLDGTVLEEVEETRTAFSIDLQPEGSSRFYRLGIVDDPRGRLETRTETVTVTEGDVPPITTTTTTRTLDDDFTLSAQFGFHFGRHRLRAGIFESSGGAAVDFGLLEEKLWMTVEAFDFSREDDLEPRLRVEGRWRLHPNLYLLGGLDDILEDERETLFFGAGVTWSDDDLKYLLGSLPSGL